MNSDNKPTLTALLLAVLDGIDTVSALAAELDCSEENTREAVRCHSRLRLDGDAVAMR